MCGTYLFSLLYSSSSFLPESKITHLWLIDWTLQSHWSIQAVLPVCDLWQRVQQRDSDWKYRLKTNADNITDAFSLSACRTKQLRAAGKVMYAVKQHHNKSYITLSPPEL